MRTFEQILRDKLASVDPSLEQTEGSDDVNRFWFKTELADSIDPRHLSYLLGKIPRSTRSRPNIGKAYPGTSAHKSTNAQKSTDANESANQWAYIFFERMGAPLSRNFGESELKARFRTLARVLHPDLNKNPAAAEHFRRLKKAYDQLRATLY